MAGHGRGLHGRERAILTEHPDLRWDEAIRIALDDTDDTLAHVRAEKKKAREKSGDFTDEGEDEDRRAQPEQQIQRALCDHLRLRAKRGVLWLHPANGGLRNPREAARFKRMGVLPGASDLLLWHQGNSFALELKSPNGSLSEAQKEFLARFNDAGGHSACAEGIDDAISALEGWQLLRGRAK